MACRSTVLYSLTVALLFWCQLYTVRAQVIGLTGPSDPQAESIGDIEVCVSFNAVSTAVITLQTIDGTADAGDDYVALSRNLTFNPGAGSNQCVNITIIDDTVVEDSVEFFTVRASSTGLTPTSVTLIISDVDQITIGFDRMAYTALEGTVATVCAEILDGSVQRSTEFTFDTVDGSAVSSDFLLTTPMGTFEIGESRTCTNVTILPDTSVEDTETFTVTLTGSTSVVVSDTANTTTVFIEDDDGVTVSLANSSLSVSESSSGTTVSLCVSLDGAPGPIDRDIEVTLNTVPGTAGINDFQPLSNQILTIPSTTTQGGSVCQPINITGDTVEEDDKSFTVTASVASPDIFTPPATATVIILNDDVANCPVLSIDNGMVMQSTTLGSMAAYNCDAGYNLQGNGARTCQADSSWTGTPPDCTAVSCMSLADPMNGVVEVNSTTFNSQANYSCNVGFVLVGDSNRTCQADTTWTGEQPDCNGARGMCINLLFILLAVLAVQVLL